MKWTGSHVIGQDKKLLISVYRFYAFFEKLWSHGSL